MRVRLKLDRLHDLLARSNLSQNHWAIRIGMSRGHWSEIVNGKHVHPSPKTRERMLEVFGVSFEDLFEIEPDPPTVTDPSFQAALSERYLIDEEIGQGGMGTVYLARDVKLGRQVAIKVVSPEAVSGIGVAQFLKETRYTARLQHQNILALHDAGEAAGHPYYVMPYVKGGSLRDLLERRGRLSLEETLRIAAGLARALDHAHQHHVLHCDIKPENILLGDHHVYVADFGISRAIHAEVFEWGRRHEIDSSAGTPAYVSPEQASGEQSLDERADVYSFSCVVFEMLTGRAPFTGRNTMEVVAQRFTSEVPKLREWAPDVPLAVTVAVDRAMALVPARRTASASSFHRELQAAVADRTRIARVWRWAAYASDTAIRLVSGRTRRRSGRFLRGGVVEGLALDLRQAFRSLRRGPAFIAMTVLTLALGIGANTAIFTVVNAVLLRPLPYERPGELLMMWEIDRLGRSGEVSREWTVAPANYTAWVERTSAFDDIAAFNYWRPTVTGDGPAEQLVGSVVTPNMFDLLGVRPMVGSGFTPDHGIPGNNGVVLLSYGLWQRRYGGDPGVVGRRILLSGTAHTVLGVMPPTYRHPEPNVLGEAQVWRPIAWSGTEGDYGRHLRTIGRMKPGVSYEVAAADLAAVARQLEIDFPSADEGWGVVVKPLREELFGEVRGALLMMLAGAGFVLLIVCANVANLVLARSHGRRREFAIRASLGAGRRRLARQLVAESVLLTLAGGAVGLLAVRASTGFLLAVQGQYIPSVADIRVDASVLTFVMALALVTGVVFGLLPVLQSSRTDLRAALTEETAGAGVSEGARRLRSGLVVAEVLLATVLAVGAGLMGRSFATLIGVSVGFETDRLLSVDIRMPSSGYEEQERRLAFLDQLSAGMHGLPGVRDAAFVSDLPFTTENRYMWVKPAGDLPAELEWTLIEYRRVGPEYFRTMGISFISGRDFRWDDRGEGDFVPVIVNREMSTRFWPGVTPVGRQFPVRDYGAPAVVIGVVGDILDDGFDSQPEPRFYVPFLRQTGLGAWMVLRSDGDPSALGPAVRRAVDAIEPAAVVSGFRTMDDLADESVADERIALTLAGVFSLLALVLAGVGIYGVMSYAVGERRREIGIRTALGAQRSDVMRLVLGHSGMLTLVGTLGGLALALSLARLLRGFLYGVQPTDPLTFGATALVLAAVALTASYVPAARATRVPPVEALRSER